MRCRPYEWRPIRAVLLETDMTRRLCALALVLLTIPFSTGCLVKATTHRLYLSPRGALTWSVLERDVRSNDSNPSTRASEEQAFIDAIAGGAHPTHEALARLVPYHTSVRLVRAERPYTVLTDARFERVDAVVEKLLSELQIPGKATLRRAGEEWTLTVEVDLSSVHEDDVDSPVAALVEELDRYRVVLTEGRFVAASGFEIEDDGAAVRLAPDRIPTDRPAELRLTWR
jgi:hypothetical protein